MRGKRAKQLRKIARQVSQGMPDKQLLGKNTTKKVLVTNPKHKQFGERVEVTSQSAVNSPNSTRGIYRRLKKEFKKGNITC